VVWECSVTDTNRGIATRYLAPTTKILLVFMGIQDEFSEMLHSIKFNAIKKCDDLIFHNA
jgi:hypothetical protein